MGEPSRFAAAAGAVAHVLVDELATPCTVAGDDGHHLQRVRRLRDGEPVTAADGAGRWRAYTVVAVRPGELDLEASGPVQHEPDLRPGLAVAFGVTKGDQPELVVGQLTQLGVDRILAVATARSVARWDETRAEHATARLARVAREAAMQSRRARLPEVQVLGSIDVLVDHPGLVVAERGGAGFGEVPEPDGGEWLLLVGPEGGFDPGERDRLAGAARVAVGPFQLRATTAATVVSGLFTSRRGASMFSRGREP